VQVKELKRPTNDWPKDQQMKEIGKVSCISCLKAPPLIQPS
jgi:hypothetical protein